MRGLPHLIYSRQAWARLSSTLVCSILLTLKPFSVYGGESAFLVLTVKEVVFSSQNDLAQQLEATILNLAGSFVGIGIGGLSQLLSRLTPVDSTYARVIPAVVLVAMSFVAGYTKSRLPRLQLASRISVFILIFVLTADVELRAPGIIWRKTRSFLWICITAAVVSLICSILLLEWTSTKFAAEVAAAFSTLHDAVDIGLKNSFSGERPSPRALELEAILVRQSVGLAGIYSQAAFELRIGRVGVKAIKPFIGIVEHLRRELAWGMSLSWCSHSSIALREPCLNLGDTLLAAMDVVRRAILLSFTHNSPAKAVDKLAIELAKSHMLEAQSVLRDSLRQMCDELDLGTHEAATDQRRTADLCLFVVSLLQMAHEMEHALHIARSIVHAHQSSATRLWTPRFSKAWLGVAPSTFILEDRDALVEDENPATDLSEDECKQGLAEQEAVFGRGVMRLITPPQSGAARFTAKWAASLVYRVWNHTGVLNARLALSKALRSIQRSQHAKYALKQAVGVALLSMPAFLPADSAGRKWFTNVRGQWMIISFTWVLDTTSGATWRVGYLRISGTIIGAIYAYVAWLICRTNPYALVLLMTLVEIPISWVVIRTTFPSLGVVASITLPPILFTQYIEQDTTISVIHIALLRGLMIGAGILAALFINSVLFPRHCRVLFLNNSGRTFGYLNRIYMAAGRDLFLYDDKKAINISEKHDTLKLELQTRNTLHRLSLLLTTMMDEVSLQPKPIAHYRRVVKKLQRFLDLEIGLRKVREKIPRETVRHVYKERREFISCICITLFACEQAFNARQPLPQFLPSTRKALGPLESHVRHRIRLARENAPDSMTAESLVYSFAEGEIMKDLVETLEELLDFSRQLFGTSKWLLDGTAKLPDDDGWCM